MYHSGMNSRKIKKKERLRYSCYNVSSLPNLFFLNERYITAAVSSLGNHLMHKAIIMLRNGA